MVCISETVTTRRSYAVLKRRSYWNRYLLPATGDIGSYYKVKRISLITMQKEDLDQLEIYEFNGENF